MFGKLALDRFDDGACEAARLGSRKQHAVGRVPHQRMLELVGYVRAVRPPRNNNPEINQAIQ